MKRLHNLKSWFLTKLFSVKLYLLSLKDIKSNFRDRVELYMINLCNRILLHMINNRKIALPKPALPIKDKNLQTELKRLYPVYNPKWTALSFRNKAEHPIVKLRDGKALVKMPETLDDIFYVEQLKYLKEEK